MTDPKHTPIPTTAKSDGRSDFVFDDGGRAATGYKGDAGDCVTRAIAIATGLPYQQVYDLVNTAAVDERPSKRRRGKSSARTGVHKPISRQIMESLGWEWTPTMQIGQGCKVHLRADELPRGRLVVAVSKHLVAMVDGVIHDTHDCSRGGTRCVYGYFRKGRGEHQTGVIPRRQHNVAHAMVLHAAARGPQGERHGFWIE